MVTTLYLIRHGETEGESDGVKRYKGSIDVPLSLKGEGQMRLAAEFVSGRLRESACAMNLSYLRDVHSSAVAASGREEGLAAVYCSTLSRAQRSAEIVAGPHGLEPVATPDLCERSFGVWEGMSFTEIKEAYPVEFVSWASDPVEFSPVGGESTCEVRDRVIRALGEILGNHPGGNVAIVAHGGVNRIILCDVMGMPLENIFRIEQDYACVNVIEFWDRYPVVKLLNGGSAG